MDTLKTAVPKISVAMCTYNGASFLPVQLDSILDQTMPPDELVVQDDRSDDATLEIIETFARHAPFPVRVVVNEQRLRPTNNFAACMARCEGDIIVLTDQDDAWMPDRLEQTIAAYRDPAVTFTFSDAPLIDQDGRMLGRSIFDTVPISKSDRLQLAGGRDLLPIILRYGVLYGTTMSFRRDMVRVGLPVPGGWGHDDWLSLVSACFGDSKRLAPVTRYRQHAAQVVGAGSAGFQASVNTALRRSGDWYLAELTKYENALKAVADRPALRSLKPALEAKLVFLHARRTIHQGGIAGLVALVREISNRDYKRFAHGLRSIAKDLALLGRATAGKG